MEYRPLSTNEGQAIINGYEQLKERRKTILIVWIVAMVALALCSLLWGYIWGDMVGGEGEILFNALLLFVITAGIPTGFILKYFIDYKCLVNRVRDEAVYCAEAIYDYELVRPRIVYLKKYKKLYGGYSLFTREPLECGDRVIVIKGKRWVYKARA